MFAVLVKKQLFEMFRTFFFDSRKGKLKTRIQTIESIVLYLGLIGGLLGMSLFQMAASLCEPLVAMNLGWLYFAIMSLIAILIGTLIMMFSVSSGVFTAKDNDLLLSMPIPLRTIVDSRLLSIWIMGSIYMMAILVPMDIVWFMNNELTLLNVLCPIAVSVLLTAVSLLLSCIAGWAIARLSSKVKNKSAVRVLFSLTFLGLYYFVYFKAYDVLGEIGVNAGMVSGAVTKYGYPLVVLGNAACGNVLYLAGMAGVLAVLLIIVRTLMTKSFMTIIGGEHTAVRTVYKEKKTQRNSVSMALLKRELDHYLSSSMYILNCSLSSFMMIAAAVAAVIKGETLMETLLAVFGDLSFVNLLLILGVCAASSMNDLTAPSVSLEGKTIWLSQSLPVDPWEVLKSKINLHLLVTSVPSLILSLAVIFVSKMSVLEMIMAIVLPQLLILAEAEFGLIIGLNRADLHWTNEITVIKQSFGVVIALLGGMLFALGMFGLAILVYENTGTTILYLGYTAVCAAVAYAEYIWLKKKGPAIYTSLS